MTRQIFFFLFLFSCGQTAIAQFNYPASKKVDSADTWHNVTVKDPYRWLEDLKNPEVVSWFKAQANFTILHVNIEVVCKATTTPNFNQTNEIINQFDTVRNRI